MVTVSTAAPGIPSADAAGGEDAVVASAGLWLAKAGDTLRHNDPAETMASEQRGNFMAAHPSGVAESAESSCIPAWLVLGRCLRIVEGSGDSHSQLRLADHPAGTCAIGEPLSQIFAALGEH